MVLGLLASAIYQWALGHVPVSAKLINRRSASAAVSAALSRPVASRTESLQQHHHTACRRGRAFCKAGPARVSARVARGLTRNRARLRRERWESAAAFDCGCGAARRKASVTPSIPAPWGAPTNWNVTALMRASDVVLCAVAACNVMARRGWKLINPSRQP